MYKIIAVDDEPISLKKFEHIICKEPRVELVASFVDPVEALDYIRRNPIDIAFLDIEMPNLNGLELAERIGEIDPYVNIIFVTAFDQYALDAFKAHAIGYLLKPLDIREVSLHIDKLTLNKSPRVAKPMPTETKIKKLTVKCLGQYSCYASESPDENILFRTAKTAELFAFLVHHYKSPVTKYFILDSLFPDIDYEKSNKLFYVSCSYLRSAFSKYNIVDVLIRENDSYRINTAMIDCDYINFMNYYERLNELTLDELKDASDQYNGEYLLGRSYEWAFETKPYVENLHERMQFRYVDLLIEDNRTDEAISILEKFLTNDPLRENTVSKLMTLLVKNGHKDQAVSVYQTYEKKLKEQLDMTPSPSLKNIIK